MVPDHGEMLKAARALDRAGERERALEGYRGYLLVEPGSVEGWADMGGLLMQSGRLDEADAACVRALQLDRSCLVASINLACVRMHQGRLGEAEKGLREILGFAPGRRDAALALAECLVKQDALAEARTVLAGLLGREPGNLQAHQMLGQIFHRLGLWAEYQTEIERRMGIEPGCAYLDYERGYLKLLSGELAEGWRRYESRLRVPRLTRFTADLPQPRWRGEPFPGRTLLLRFEQGFGDTLMFVRLAPLVKALGGRVLLEAQPELADLVATCAGIDQVIPWGDPLPPFDLHLPLLSLPGVLGIELEGIPASIPYLDIPERVPNREWLARVLAASGSCTRVGLGWTGSSAYRNDAARSIPPAALAPLAALPNVFWHGFQVGPQEAPPLPGFVSLAPWLGNFSDTAYALSGMDLVITVDTALAHLAGALGIPTFLLLPFGPDWRWLLGRDDSPWYPSMRIYRQAVPGDWSGVVTRVAADLAG